MSLSGVRGSLPLNRFAQQSPTEGIQPNIIQQIGEVIEYLRDQGDMAIVLVEQYFDFAYGLADGFYVLERGTVRLKGPKRDLSKDDLRAAVSV